MYRPKPSNFHPFEGYTNDFVKDFFALSLVSFAYVNFFKINKIKSFDTLKSFVRSGAYTDKTELLDFLKNNPELATNSLIDYILISISFENYFKAKLLLKGYLIHEIIKEKNVELFKRQRKEPIESRFITFETKDKSSELKENTLNYELLLKNKKYSRLYDLDDITLEFLSILNKKRNNLHLYMSEKFELSNAEINNLEKLKKIVEYDFATLNNHLIDKMGGQSNSRIIIKK